jgi:hypothetical protein
MVTLSPSEFELLTPEERKSYFADEEMTVFGRTKTGEPAFERNRSGTPIELGLGAAGRENLNHFAAIRKWEGEDAYQAAIAKAWKTNSEHAARIMLPKPKGR